MSILADTITPTAKALRTKLIADTVLATAISTRCYLTAAPETATLPYVVMIPQSSTETDPTHGDLSWQQQQWDLYAVAATADKANELTGMISRILNDTILQLGSDRKTLTLRRMATLPAQRIRLTDTTTTYNAAAMMMIGVPTSKGTNL